MENLQGFAALGLVLLVYFLPTIIGKDRGHRKATQIFLTNLILGWTGIGWIIALIWSFGTDRIEEV